MEANPLIKDLEHLFRYSGMVDQLRDTSRVLCENGEVTRDTLRGMAAQYESLKDALRSVLAGAAETEIGRWAPAIDPETVSVDGIFFASAALARWIDMVHQTPKFLVAEELAGAAAVEMTAKAKATLGAVEGIAVPGGRPGTYL
jgi:hypothetical protein